MIAVSRRYIGMLVCLSLLTVGIHGATPATVTVTVDNGAATDTMRTIATLEEGWNALYWHVSHNVNYDRLAGPCGQPVVMGLHNGQLYQETENLPGGTAYLIRTEQQCRIESDARSMTSGLRLQDGWNLVGADAQYSLNALGKRCGGVVAFQLQNGQLEQVSDTLEEETAYLVRAEQACNVPPPVPE